jgi:hypothetical protein
MDPLSELIPDTPEEILEEEKSPFERKMSSLGCFLSIGVPVFIFLYMIFVK